MNNIRKKVFLMLTILISIIVISKLVKNYIKENDKVDEKIYISELIEDECTEEYEEMQKVATVVATEEKLSANALLVLKKYYSSCDHTINEYAELPQELVNMTKEEVQSFYSDWEVIGFESGKLTLYREFDNVCGEHFKLKLENGKVVIYIINNDGSESVYEKTNISSQYLTSTDIINMKDGLEVYGKEDLNRIIEDFE